MTEIKKGDTVYLVKYALTVGVQVKTCDKASGDGYASIREEYGSSWDYYFEIGKDIFLDRNDAVKAAEEMRIKKLKSLDKQIKKLSVLKF